MVDKLEELRKRIGELEETIQMKDGLIGHLKAENKQRRREPNSYFEEARRVAEASSEPIVIIGNIMGNVPEENKYYVVLYVNSQFTEDLGWNVEEIRGEVYTRFVRGKPEEIISTLKGEISGDISMEILDRRGKYRRRIIRKVDIPYEDVAGGKKMALTYIYFHHPGLRTKKGVKTIESLKKEHELKEKKEEEARKRKGIEETIRKAKEAIKSSGSNP